MKKLNRFQNIYEYILLAVTTVTVLFLNLLNIGLQINHKIILVDTLDFSWSTDYIERFRHGIIAGKDFIFTYGPLYQLIASIPSILLNLHSYISVLYSPLTLICVNSLILFILSKQIIKTKKTYLYLYIFLLIVTTLLFFNDPNSLFRLLIPFLYSFLFVNFINQKKLSIKFYLLAFFPAIVGLYVFDLFIICFITTVCFSLFKILKNHNNSKTILNIVIYLFFILIAETVISILLSGDLSYLYYSLDTVKNYQLLLNIPLSFNKSIFTFAFPALLILSLIIIRHKQIKIHLFHIFSILAFTALLEAKTALIRMDDGHILLGTLPSLIALLIIFSLVIKNKKWIIAILLIITIINPSKIHLTQMLNVNNLNSAFSTAISNNGFFNIYKLTNTAFSKNDFIYFTKLIKNNPGKIMIYPYDSYILNINNQTFNTYALQLYQYSYSPTEEKTVQNLKNNPPKYIILGVDTKGALNLDDIPNLSRNPIFAKWLINNYIVEKNNQSYLILKFVKNKIIKNTKNTCSVYDIVTQKSIDTEGIFEFIKPSTYYLRGKIAIRLPVVENSKNLLIFENYTNPKALGEMINSGLDFNKFSEVKSKDLSVIKKYQFPKIKQTYKDITIKCY